MANYRLRIGTSTAYPLAANIGSYTLTGVDALFSRQGAVGLGLVPDAPVFLRTSGSLVGQATILFLKPSYLANGDAFTTDVVTSTVLYAFTTQDAADNGSLGSYTASVNCGTNSTGTLTLSPGTYWICAECTNSGGTSYPSQPIQVTVT